MSEYDNTNSGVFFKPHDDQSLIGQGMLNIEGRDTRIVVVNEKISRDGAPMMVVYQRISPLFVNDSDNEKAPDRSGPMDLHPHLRLAAWRGEKDGRPYYSLRLSEKEGGGSSAAKKDDGWDEPAQKNEVAQTTRDLDDEIPF